MYFMTIVFYNNLLWHTVRTPPLEGSYTETRAGMYVEYVYTSTNYTKNTPGFCPINDIIFHAMPVDSKQLLYEYKKYTYVGTLKGLSNEM